MNTKKIGNFIKKLREEKGLTQEQLAEKVFIGRGAISKWETGKNLPDIQSLQKLSELFSVTIEELLSGEEKPKENVTLTIYKERNNFKKKINILIIVLVILLSLFLTYYFLSFYKSVNIYTINGENENFSIKTGLFVETNENIYFNLGNIENKNNNPIEKVELFYNINDKENLILYREDLNIAFFDYAGYEEYIDLDKIEEIIDNMYIRIYYSDKKETIKLNITKDYTNDKLIFVKREKASKDLGENSTMQSQKSEITDFEEKLKMVLLKDDNNNYANSFKTGDETIDIFYIPDERLLSMTINFEDKIMEELYYNFIYKDVTYQNYYMDVYAFGYKDKYECFKGECGSITEMKSKLELFRNIIKNIVE